MIVVGSNEVDVKIFYNSKNPLPFYAKEGDSGVDLYADLGDVEGVHIEPRQTLLIPTGIYSEIPNGYEIQIRSKSGLAINDNLCVLNAPGTVDAVYRNEWKVILHNAGEKPYFIKNGQKIAQAVLCPVYKIKWKAARLEDLSETDRGLGGFGSTGLNKEW